VLFEYKIATSGYEERWGGFCPRGKVKASQRDFMGVPRGGSGDKGKFGVGKGFEFIFGSSLVVIFSLLPFS
jgi:hypothetical protein